MNRRSFLAWLAASSASHSVWAAQDPELLDALSKALSSDSFDDKFDASVWLTLMSQRLSKFNSNPTEVVQILTSVHQQAARNALPPEIVLSVMHVESLFDRFAISRVGAQGLMQIMPFWKEEIDRPEANLFDIDTNVRFGCTILRHYLDRETGNWTRALARYNGSLGKTWYPERVMNAWDRYWFPG